LVSPNLPQVPKSAETTFSSFHESMLVLKNQNVELFDLDITIVETNIALKGLTVLKRLFLWNAISLSTSINMHRSINT